MAELRFKVELNKGGVGVTMSKLASVMKETELFLQLLVEDIAIEDKQGQWIARDFENHSVGLNAEYVGTVTAADEGKFSKALDIVTDDNTDMSEPLINSQTA